MFMLLIGLIFFALVVYILWYVLNTIPLPQPVKVVISVIFVLVCLLMLMNYMPADWTRGRLFH